MDIINRLNNDEMAVDAIDDAIAEITALRAALDEKERHLAGAIESADKSNDAWNEMRAAHEALLRRTQSLETALDQERADNERLRAFAWTMYEEGRGDPFGDINAPWIMDAMAEAALLDGDYQPTALLSGRGETAQ